MNYAIDKAASFDLTLRATEEQEGLRRRNGGHARPVTFEQLKIADLPDPTFPGRSFANSGRKDRTYAAVDRYSHLRDSMIAGSPQPPLMLCRRQLGLEYFDAKSEDLAAAARLAGCESVPAVVMDRLDT